MYDLRFTMLSWAAAPVPRNHDEGVAAVARAVQAFDLLLLKGHLKGLWAKLTGRSRALVDLDAVRAGGILQGAWSRGVRSVPIAQIKGSEGRTRDFDAEFLPRQERTRERWVSVAAAWRQGAPMPPVDLVQVGETYFVRDGHHRVSVARMMGQEHIEAEVTVWQLRPRPAAMPLPVPERAWPQIAAARR